MVAVVSELHLRLCGTMFTLLTFVHDLVFLGLLLISRPRSAACVSFRDRLTAEGRLLRVRSGHAEVEVQ
jgi:hypothetical protein